MKVHFLITARLKSTRLPMKLMRPLCGRPIFAHMLDRLKLSRRADQIVICTSNYPQDDALEEFARTEGVGCFRGDEDDVLKRLSDAATSLSSNYILNITADAPFADPGYADRIVEAFEKTKADLIRALDLPHGIYSYGIKPSALRKVMEIKDDRNTEVWGRYFTDTGLFQVYDLPIENTRHRNPNLRMTLDYPEDLQFFERVFKALYKPGRVFSLDEILDFLDRHPEVGEINRHCEARYYKRWFGQSGIKLKPRFEVKRAAIFGCGSIGQRHIRNLRSLGITDLMALRSHQGHFQKVDPQLGIRETQDWEEVLAFQPDIAVISNPTSLHPETVRRVLPHVRGIFVEKPLAPSLTGVRELLEQIKTRNVVSFVGYNLQFHPAVKEIRKLLGADGFGNPLVLQGQVGHWLPDWHPYEDYQKAYYARRDLGGGVLRTLIHEVHLAIELMGPAQSVSAVLPASESLPLDVDTIADLMVQHRAGTVSQLHLDFLQRPAHRCGTISCERGWIQYDLIRPKVTVQIENEPAPQVAWEDTAFDGNVPYVEEMRTFLQYVREGRVHHEFDAWRGVLSLAVVDAAFTSAATGRQAAVTSWA